MRAPRDDGHARRWPLTRVLAAVLGLSALTAGCAEKRSSGPTSYRDSARAVYAKGVSALQDKNYPEAVKLFALVKNRFPFSSYATLAELRLCDANFAQEKHLEAIDGYKQFIRFHPTHPQVLDGYASYRICQAYFQQIPTDWFLVPPSHEKDQSSARDALRELRIAIKMHPQSKYIDRIKDLHRRTLRKLADHELYVARFYLERDKPKATILRLEGLLQRYPEAGVHPEVLLMLGQTYLKLDQRQRALQTFSSLIDKHPHDHHAAKAKLYVQYLTRRN